MATETTDNRVPEHYVLVCAREDLPERGKKTVLVGDARLLLVTSDAALFAVEDRCPQTGAPIAHGEVIGDTIITPTNGARYSLHTGRYLGGGQSWLHSHWLSVWPLRVIDDKIYVRPPHD